MLLLFYEGYKNLTSFFQIKGIERILCDYILFNNIGVTHRIVDIY